ncbi:MAG: excinuclease ABC subunit UvrC [Syntrophales bacterium]|jgi:excinuclease ABC subunit C|nr:excinuclease ABC subunit UvrC [Syntrophales bacterium]
MDNYGVPMAERPLDKIIQTAPRSPGAYLMKDAAGKIIYVGKARDLRARLRNYVGGGDTRPMIPFLVSRVQDIEWILTDTEKEALILENTLIKEHRPRYNVDFRDDKAYFHIRVQATETFPRFQLVRRTKKDGARYFGPYPSSSSAKETLRFLQTVFPLRTCRDVELRSRRRPCLEYQIGRCLGPCVQLVTEEAYQHAVRDAMTILEGRETDLLQNLDARMKEAAQALQFEEAAALRDKIASIRTTLEIQRTASLAARDQDVFGLYREGALTQVCLLKVRAGKMVGKQTFPLIRVGLPTGEILAAVLTRHYDAGHEIPGEILLTEASDDRPVLEEWLGEKRGRSVKIMIPKRGQGRALIRMANRNSESTLKIMQQTAGPDEAMKRLVTALGLRKAPERMECFDISNIGGEYAVGSMVVFSHGVPYKDHYRRFRIRTVAGADDYAMMYEVLQRRYSRKEALPDLLMVDGGKGQLSVAISVLKDLNISGVEVIALAKGGYHTGEDPRGGGQEGRYQVKEGLNYDDADRENIPGEGPKGCDQRSGKMGDRVFLPARKDAIDISRWPAALFLLQRLRDEAHRFAVSYHRKVKEKEDFNSLLDRIQGIGPEKRKALLKGLGDMGKIREATVIDLQKITGIGRELATAIVAFFRKENGISS